jgi:membrane protease YdiL (CAAX protease family)
MSDISQSQRARASPWFYFSLVFLLSIPFYMLGLVGERLPIARFLPLSALMTFVPMIAALILVSRESGVAGVKTLLGRVLDYLRIRGVGWVLAALLLMPMLFLLQYGVLNLEERAPPSLQIFSVAEIAAFALMFFVGAIGEELGWQGYAYGGLKKGRSALNAALILGAAWGLWHVIPFLEMGRSVDWILWQCLGAIALRVIIVWLFENAGQSVFIAVLFHTTINLPWGVFTTFEIHFDPFVMFAMQSLVALIVVAMWGPSTLARFRRAKGHHETA